MKKRLFAFLVSIILLLPSCTGNLPDVTVGPDGSAAPEQTEAAAISLAGYTVIRPEHAEAGVLSAAIDLKKELEASAEGIAISDDWYRSGESLPDQAKEILVGNTNRAETQELLRGLLADDYAVKYFPESGRIAICGGSDEATVKAIGYFLEFCVSEGSIESTLSFCSVSDYAVGECLLAGAPIGEYAVAIPDSADADEKYAAQIIADTVLEKTGVRIETVKLSKTDAERLIIVRKSEEVGGDRGEPLTVALKDGAVTVSAKGGLIVRAARMLTEALFPNGEERVSLPLEEELISYYKAPSYPALDDFGAKPIALADQLGASIAVYDLSAGEPVLKYEFKPQTVKGFSLEGYANRVDEARLRYSEKWGTYVILFTSSSGYTGVASYPAEECLWQAPLKGTSPHSIEYLPSGTVAVASSGGSAAENGFIRLYSTEKGKNGNIFAEDKLTSAHALLWDDLRGVLWAMGNTEIVAYEVGADPAKPALKRISVYGCSDMKGGHDLSAVCGNEDLLWVSGSRVLMFDKTKGSLIDDYVGADQIDTGSVKCICSFPDGDAARTVATGVYADHNTDRFTLYSFEGSAVASREYIFEGRAFYKARAFYADYN